MLLAYRYSILILMQVPYLGQRVVDEKGKAGPYHWLSYAEVSKIRTEIGSGLLHYGMKSGSTLGLYSVNCRGACPSNLLRFPLSCLHPVGVPSSPAAQA